MEKEITVRFEELDEKAMFMNTHFGDGELDGVKFDASFSLPTMALVVTIGKKRYRVDQRDIIAEIILKTKGHE